MPARPIQTSPNGREARVMQAESKSRVAVRWVVQAVWAVCYVADVHALERMQCGDAMDSASATRHSQSNHAGQRLQATCRSPRPAFWGRQGAAGWLAVWERGGCTAVCWASAGRKSCTRSPERHEGANCAALPHGASLGVGSPGCSRGGAVGGRGRSSGRRSAVGGRRGFAAAAAVAAAAPSTAPAAASAAPPTPTPFLALCRGRSIGGGVAGARRPTAAPAPAQQAHTCGISGAKTQLAGPSTGRTRACHTSGDRSASTRVAARPPTCHARHAHAGARRRRPPRPPCPPLPPGAPRLRPAAAAPRFRAAAAGSPLLTCPEAPAGQKRGGGSVPECSCMRPRWRPRPLSSRYPSATTATKPGTTRTGKEASRLGERDGDDADVAGGLNRVQPLLLGLPAVLAGTWYQSGRVKGCKRGIQLGDDPWAEMHQCTVSRRQQPQK
jgi:pyruvate/2-oxoglutarate dehydrogenase complex dihydrolipoamide acyltransferase (E2) component